MSQHLGDFPVDTTIYYLFGSYDSNGASVTLAGLAVTDIEIYKNGGVIQRASDSGYTLLDTDGIDFDTITGIHGFSINLSDNSDAGFYAAGNWYNVVVSAVTIDTQTVNFVFSFTVEISNGAIARLKDGTTGLAAIEALVDDLESRLSAARAGYLDNLSAGAVAQASVCTEGRLAELDAANLPTDVADVKTDTAATLSDTGTDGVLLATSAIQAVADKLLPKKNTAFSNVEFLMVDSTDHVTPKTGLTVSGTRSIDGGAFSAVSGSIAEVGNGIYQFDALAADMNGDVITFRFTATGADDTYLTVRTGG